MPGTPWPAAQTGIAILQVRDPETLLRYQTGITALLENHQAALADDFTDPAHLWPNTASCLPLLWLAADGRGQVLALAALSDVIPGRHAFLHGATLPRMPQRYGTFRRRDWLRLTDTVADLAIRYAFEHLEVMKVKAEFDAINRGAKGFCLRRGFRQEARLVEDTRLQGQACDVLLYTLTRQQFQERFS